MTTVSVIRPNWNSRGSTHIRVFVLCRERFGDQFAVLVGNSDDIIHFHFARQRGIIKRDMRLEKQTMTAQTVTLTLPQTLYERARETAQAIDRPVEQVLTQSIAISLPILETDLPPDVRADLVVSIGQ